MQHETKLTMDKPTSLDSALSILGVTPQPQGPPRASAGFDARMDTASLEAPYRILATSNRRGAFFLTIPTERLGTRFGEVLDAARAAGGWYSRKRGTQPGGFGFEEHADASRFALANLLGEPVAVSVPDAPERGKAYRVFGAEGTASIANGNTWKASEVNGVHDPSPVADDSLDVEPEDVSLPDVPDPIEPEELAPRDPADPLVFGFPRECKLALACGTESGARYAMNGVRIDPAKGRAFATNGRILASIPIEIIGNPEGFEAVTVPREIVKSATMTQGSKGRPASIEVEPAGTIQRASTIHPKHGAVADEVIAGDFPRVEAVQVPRSSSARRICFDAALLLDLAKALGSDGIVTLQLPETEGAVSPIRVETAGAEGAMMVADMRLDFSDDGAEGVIMPCTVEPVEGGAA